MPVVDVRVVRVAVPQRLVAVRVAVRLAGRVVGAVFVPVVFVVDVPVVVFQRLVLVFVLVPLGQVQPHPETHQAGGQDEGDRNRLPLEDQGEGGTGDWGQPEVCN